MKFIEAFEVFFSKLLKGSQFESISFWVGGAVRDKLMGRLSIDFDLVVEKPNGANELAHFLSQRYSEFFSSPHHLGQGYPIWQIVLKQIPVELQGFQGIENLEIQIADTQKEMFPDPHSRQRVTQFGSLLEDAARRDFTCNMLYQNCVSGEILDPCGLGVADIKSGILRAHPSVAAEKMFSEDPLRILRLFRFEALFGWNIDIKLLNALELSKSRISILSPERIYKEWKKVIEAGAHVRFIRALESHNVLEQLFPELLGMRGCRQDAQFHFEGDVWVHTLLVMEKLPSDLELQLAALLHDIGKPATQSFKNDRIQFIGHEKVSAELAKDFLKKWGFSSTVISNVELLILLHLRGYDAPQWSSLKPARKLLREAGPLKEKLLQLIEADTLSSLSPNGQPRLEPLEALKKAIVEASVIPMESKALLNGNEIMNLLNLGPGPRIKEVQNALIELEDDFASSGKKLDVHAARNFVLERFRKSQ